MDKEISTYKVTCREGFDRKNEYFVEAKTEAEAIIKAEGMAMFPMSKIRAKEIYNPTIEDYYFARGTTYTLFVVSSILLALLLFK